MSAYTATVTVRPKRGVLDPEAETTRFGRTVTVAV
jgi:phosphoribosylformylglycinamidine (FGAM) synthase PurS component